MSYIMIVEFFFNTAINFALLLAGIAVVGMVALIGLLVLGTYLEKPLEGIDDFEPIRRSIGRVATFIVTRKRWALGCAVLSLYAVALVGTIVEHVF